MLNFENTGYNETLILSNKIMNQAFKFISLVLPPGDKFLLQNISVDKKTKNVDIHMGSTILKFKMNCMMRVV